MKYLRGLFTDGRPLDQPEGTYRHALNFNLNSEKGALSSEGGVTKLFDLPAGHTLIGSHVLSDGRIVLFSTDDAIGAIGIFTDTYTSLFSSADLHFSTATMVSATSRINNQSEHLIYWTDGINPVRYMNVETPYVGTIEALEVFSNISDIATISLTSVNNAGGALPTGAYHIAIAYVGEDKTRTNFFNISNPISIYRASGSLTPTQITGDLADTPSSKSITISLANVDTAFTYVQFAIIRKNAGTIEPIRLLPLRRIRGNTLSYTYTGLETYTEGSLDEIIINRAFYETAQTLTQTDGRLYLGNLKGRKDIGYQKFANNIVVEAVTHEITDAITKPNEYGPHETYNSYRNPEIAFNLKGYQRDEVYAFYIAWILRDGTESKASHIPGRASATTTPNQATGSITVTGPIPDTAAPAKGKFIFHDIFPGADPLTPASFTLSAGIGAPNTTASIPVYAADTLEDVANRARTALVDTPQINTDWTIGVVTAVNDEFFGLSYEIELTYKINGTGGNVAFSRTTVFPSEVEVVISAIDATGGAIAGQSVGTLDVIIGGVSMPVTTVMGGMTANNAAAAIATVVHANADLTAIATLADIAVTTVANTEVFNGPIELNFTSASSVITSLPITSVAMSGGSSGGNELGAFVDANIGFATAPKNFQFDGYPYANGMAYWENKEEVYPNTEDFDVYDVNGLGEPVPVMDGLNPVTLRNQPVRHHHFPEYRYNPFFKGRDTSNSYFVLGIKLSNVKIPANLRDEVVGYKIYYANRGTRNSRIIDQSFFVNSRFDSGFFRPQHNNTSSMSPGTTVENVYYAHNFEALALREDIGSAIYYKSVVRSSPDVDTLTYNTPVGNSFFVFNDLTSRYTNPAASDMYREITAKAYVPSASETSVITLTDKGFPYNMDNNRGESKLIIRTNATYSRTSGVLNPFVANMMRYLLDVYNQFDGQELIHTGYVDTNVANCDPTNGLATFQSGNIFGGDTFINCYTYRTNKGKDDTQYGALNHMVVESRHNISLRHAGQAPEQVFWPFSFATVFLWWKNGQPSIAVEDSDKVYDNYFGYNIDYSAENNIKPAIPEQSEVEEISEFPTRIIRSRENILGETEDPFRIFLETDFKDLPRNRGSLVKIDTVANILVAHAERSIFRTKGREELVAGDSRVFIGSGDIFAVNPEELFTTELGEGGLQSKRSALSTPYGYFFVDQQAGKVYLMGEKLDPVSERGMRNWFKKNLSWGLSPYGLSQDWSLFKQDFHIAVGYDAKFGQLFVTKREYIPTQEFLTAFGLGNVRSTAIGFEVRIADVWTSVLLTDPTYFTPNFWTISYLPELGAWQSWHSYTPYLYISSLNSLISVNHEQGYRHGETNSGLFYSPAGSVLTRFPSEFAFIDNRSPEISKIVMNVDFTTDAVDSDGNILDHPEATFNKIRLMNTYQDSGILDLVYFTGANGNLRRTQRTWRVNQFRDSLNIPDGVAADMLWAYRKRFIDKYIQVWLSYNNTDGNVLYLYSSQANMKPSLR